MDRLSENVVPPVAEQTGKIARRKIGAILPDQVDCPVWSRFPVVTVLLRAHLDRSGHVGDIDADIGRITQTAGHRIQELALKAMGA